MTASSELVERAEMERKRKVNLGESESSFHLKTRRVADSGSPLSSGGLSCQTVAGNDDDALTSCCSSNGSGELTKETWKFVDLEVYVYWNSISSIQF